MWLHPPALPVPLGSAVLLGGGGLAFACRDSQQAVGPGRAHRGGQGRDTYDDRKESGKRGLSAEPVREFEVSWSRKEKQSCHPWTPCFHEQDWGRASVKYCPSASICTEEDGWTHLELNLELVYWKRKTNLDLHNLTPLTAQVLFSLLVEGSSSKTLSFLLLREYSKLC